MKWDIDKALKTLEDPRAPGTSFTRIYVDTRDIPQLNRLGLKVPKDVGPDGGAVAWVLCLGKGETRKLMFYGWSIHSTYLRAKREVKKMAQADRNWFGIPEFKKPSNSYASARRKPRK